MQVNRVTNKLLQNKFLLKSLEKISDHGTSFAAGTSLVLSLTLRTLSINSTPNIEKDNKQYAISNSIASSLVKFGIVEAVALPIENAVNRIDKNAEKYINASALKNFDPNSRSYKFVTQSIKLSAGLLTAIPKSMLTVALIPVIMDKIFKYNPKKELEKTLEKYPFLTMKNNNFFTGKEPEKQPSKTNEPAFTGGVGTANTFFGRMNDKLSHFIGSIISNKKVQSIAKKYEMEDEDIYKHMSALTDVVLTGSAVYQTNKSNSIKENCKKVLNYNNIISTAVTLFAGYKADDLIKGKTEKFVNKFKELNKDYKNIDKCVQGIHIVRPAIIFAGIYYALLPIFSIYFADKIDKFVKKVHPQK